uniref:Uncharacterized protein n=1 Tax=Oryzias melastigma TaxID=30732 RepID=A0A3B3CPL0_ORYME
MFSYGGQKLPSSSSGSCFTMTKKKIIPSLTNRGVIINYNNYLIFVVDDSIHVLLILNDSINLTKTSLSKTSICMTPR